MRRQSRMNVWYAERESIHCPVVVNFKVYCARNAGNWSWRRPSVRIVWNLGILRLNARPLLCAKSVVNIITHCCTGRLTPSLKRTRNQQLVRLTQLHQDEVNRNILLMTGRINIMAPDSSITQARALLDSAASISLITKCLAQQLRLPWHPTNFKINGVAGFSVHPRGIVTFNIAGVRSGGGMKIEVEGSVLPKVTAVLPTIPLGSVTNWKHLSGWNWRTPTMEFLHGLIRYSGVKSSARQISTAGGLGPPERRQHLRRVLVGY